MANKISDKIREKINNSIKDDNERKMVLELLEKQTRYNMQTKPLEIKKEFSLIVDQYFPFKEEDNE